MRKETAGMAVKDHSLDDKIKKAAMEEFSEHGYLAASLHKIADRAGVTTGALYTRYKNKDALFVSLLDELFSEMQSCYPPAASAYEKARISGKTEDLLAAIAFEEKLYARLLVSHYDECTLFFCRSDGSSVETMLRQMMERKTEQTVNFFREATGHDPNANVIRLIMGSEFWYFRQLLDMRLDKNEALECLSKIRAFSEAGWKNLFNELK